MDHSIPFRRNSSHHQLIVNTPSSRKPLFGSNENKPRLDNDDSNFNLAAAWAMAGKHLDAEEQFALHGHGSPSPAPRPRQPLRPQTNLQDVPLPSVEAAPAPAPLRPPPLRAALASPNKSYAWAVDDDFTAGDLQVSASPVLAAARPRSRSRPRHNTKLDEIRAREIQAQQQTGDRAVATRPRNTKLDDIRQREIEGPSRRALAQTRLSEVRELNQQAASEPVYARRSVEPQKPDHQSVVAAAAAAAAAMPKLTSDVQQPSTLPQEMEGGAAAPETREDSQALLRRLARAASSSPNQESGANGVGNKQRRMSETRHYKESFEPKQEPLKQETLEKQEPLAKQEPIKQEADTKGENKSTLFPRDTKKTAMQNLDNDPTERIEQEINLFALNDGQSERGSKRAPSPQPDEPPRDLQSMPTPRVVGAYIDTPQTVRRLSSPIRRNNRRRARSLPHARRRRPLLNTARPPSVRDDLMELQRSHNIEDSTLDDLEEMLFGRSSDDDDDNNDDNKESLEREVAQTKSTDAEIIGRLGKQLRNTVSGIRSAKQGIERLENQMSHDQKRTAPKPVQTKKTPAAAAVPATVPATYIQIPIPRVLRAPPHHIRQLARFFCSLALLLVAWAALESGTCALYCRPTSCAARAAPCTWSPHDPTWGAALPTKLDEWVAGGAGRRALGVWRERVGDAAADAWDLLRGRDLRAVDVRTLGFYEKRQHRRRLRRRFGVPQLRASESQPKWDAWRAARREQERGEVVGGEDSFAGDSRV